MFWTPASAGVTLQETFYEAINITLTRILSVSGMTAIFRIGSEISRKWIVDGFLYSHPIDRFLRRVSL